jgi:hypothetical protein
MTRIVSNWRINTKNTKLEHIDQFQAGDIFFVPGMVPPRALKHWIRTYGTPDFIVCDQAGEVIIDGLKIYSAPLRGLAFSFERFQRIDHNVLPRQVNTDFCFNFFVATIDRCNRSLLVKLIEYFKLDCCSYLLQDERTDHDMQKVITEWQSIDTTDLPLDCRSALLSPITLPAKYNKNYIIGGEYLENYRQYEWQDNLELLFAPTAISLVSEPWFDSQLASIFTEKTMYAIMGLTFPIFVGGYKHADYLKKVGLDMFDDVINHDYQYRTTLIEQSYYAIKDNLHILTNLPLAQSLRKTHLNRLLKNRDLLYENILTDHVFKEVDTWPEPLRSSINSYWYFIQNLQVGKSMRGYIDHE